MSDSDEDVAESQFKVCLVGGSQSGKTSLAQRYANDTFTKLYTPTLGVEFYLKRITLQGNRSVVLKIWDVGGAALRGGKMMDKYAFGSHAVILVYDVTDDHSFAELADWLGAAKAIIAADGRPSSVNSLQQQQQQQQQQPGTLFALLANKIDQEHLRVIKSDRHHKFAQENKLLTYAASAKTGEGVNLTFQKLAAELSGIKLTKAEQELHQKVVKAEIVTYSQNRLPPNPQSDAMKTSVCSLQ